MLQRTRTSLADACRERAAECTERLTKKRILNSSWSTRISRRCGGS